MPTDRPGERIALSAPLPGIRVMSVEQSTRHWEELHEVQTVCLVHPGQGQTGAKWRCGRSPTYETGSGEVMVMELGQVHRTVQVFGAASFSVIQIAPAQLAQLAERLELGRVPALRTGSLHCARLSTAIMSFVSCEVESAAHIEREQVLLDIVRALWNVDAGCSDSNDPVVHRGIRRVRDAIRQQFSSQAGNSKQLQLAELAAISGLSVARFPHAFKQWLGISPHAYVNLCRLNAARMMLAEGASATDVATLLGFSDLPHFSRCFRKQFGASPRSWLAMHGANVKQELTRDLTSPPSA
jgi:AraC-like DNA-binding protein